jgi:hypothetical protein
MPNGDKNIITQSTLNDFIATRKGKPNLTREELLEKFPEFNGDDNTLQSALDYYVTSNSGKYKTLEELNSKFPEFFDPKKKELGGDGLQKDWESVSKYEAEHPVKVDDLALEEVQVLPTEDQQQIDEFAEAPIAYIPQTETQVELTPEVEAKKAEEAKIQIAQKQKDVKKADQARVSAFNEDYKSTLEEAGEMKFNTFEAYADHYKPAAAKEFLRLDADKKEFKLRQKINELEEAKALGAPIDDDQIEAYRLEANNIKTDKFEEINKDISELRNLLSKGYRESEIGGKTLKTERVPLTTEEKNEIRNEIDILEGMRSDVFETDPVKLANRSREVIEKSDINKSVLAGVMETMPEGLSGRERFDRYYNVLYKKYRDQAEKAGYDVKEGEVVDEGLLSRLGLAVRSITGIMSDDEKKLIELHGTLRQLTPIYLLNQSPIKEREGFWSTFWDNLGGRLGGVAAEVQIPREQQKAHTIQEVFGMVGIKPGELKAGVGEAIKEVGKEYTYEDLEGSLKSIAMVTSAITDIGLKYAVGGGATARVLKLLGKTKIGKDITMLSKLGKLEGTTNRYYKALSQAPGITKFVAKGLGEGLKFEGAGQIFRRDRDELNFMSGFLGSSVGTLVKGAATPLVNKIFGMFGAATPKVVAKITEIGSRGIGELAEETTQELYQVYKATDNYKEFKAELERRFGKTSAKLEFIISSILMGSVFGSVNMDHVNDFYYNEATDAEKKIIDEVTRDIANDTAQSMETAVEGEIEEGVEAPSITDKDKTERAAEIKKVLDKDLQLLEEEKESEITPEERQELRDELRGIEDIPADQPAYTRVTKEAPTETEEAPIKTEAEIAETIEKEPEVEPEAQVEEAYPFDKPLQDIDIKDKSNYESVLSFLESGKEKLKKQRKETLGMGLPVAVAELGLDAMIVALKAGNQMVKVMESGRQAIINSEWYKSLNEKDQKAAIDQFAKDTNTGFGIRTPRKTPVQKKIEETTEGKITGKITIGEKKLVKRLIKSVGKGMKAGIKLTKQDIKKSILEGLEPLKGTLTKTQTSSITSRATATNFDNPKMVAKLEEHVNKVISKANYVEDLKTAKNISKKLKGAIKSKKIPGKMERIAKHIATIPFQKLDSIETYNRIAEGVLNAITGKETGFPKDIKKLLEAADTEIRAYDKAVENRRLEIEYTQSGLKEAGIDFDEFKFMDRLTKEADFEKVSEEVEKKQSKKSKFLIAVLPFRLKELKDLAKDETVDLTEKQKRTLNTIGDVDIDKLSIGQLVELNNIITEILEFDSYNRVAGLESFIEASNRAPKFKKYDEKLRASVWFHKYMTVSTFMKALVVGGRSARSFVKDLIGELDIAKNKAVTKADKFNAKVNKGFRNLSVNQNRKLGMISFVVQTQGGTIEEINTEFEERKKGVLGTVEALREKGKKSKKLFAFQAKRNRNKADKIEEAYSEYLEDTKTPEEAIAKLNDKEKAVYEMLKGEFAKIKDALADSQARYNGKEFVEYTNYLPTEARATNKFTKEEFSVEDSNTPPGTNFVDTQQAGTTIERQAVNTEGGMIYNFDLRDMVKRKYYESVYDIETLHERSVINKLINNSDFKNTLDSDIHRVLVEKLNSMISTQRRRDYNATIELPVILKQFTALIRLGKRVKLSTMDQVLKQPIPVLVHTAIYNMESPGSVFRAMSHLSRTFWDSEYRDAWNTLIAGSDIANRVLLGDTVQDREMRNEFEKLSNSNFMNKKGRVQEAIAKGASASLIYSDNAATKISWLSSYLYELEKQGIDTKDFDLIKAAKNINQEAKSQADGRTDDINNISDFSKTAELFKSKGTNDRIVRELFWNFKSFSLNAGLNTVVEFRNLFSKDATRDERFDSFKFIVGYVAQQATFNALKIYVVNVLWDRLADALLGGEDKKEEPIEKELTKFGAKTGMEIVGSVMPSLGEDVTKMAINKVYLEYKKSEWEEMYGPGTRVRGKRPPKPTKYTDNLFYVDDSKILGAYSLPYDMAVDMTEVMKAIAKGKGLSKADYLKLGSVTSTLIGVGDLDRLFSKAYVRVKREERSEKKKGRGSSRTD